MRCSKCGAKNARTRDICVRCGAELWHVCPTCGSRNPCQLEFCDGCGQRLLIPGTRSGQDAPLGEKPERIQPVFSTTPQAHQPSEPPRIKGERKQVTIMVCHVEEVIGGETPEDPEGSLLLIDRIRETLVRKVLDFEGSVFELRAGGIMAVFGLPLALEEIPQRAIRAALALLGEAASFNEKSFRDQSAAEILLRIGIHSGSMAIGEHALPMPAESDAGGDAVSTALRVAMLAEPGAIYVTEDTFRLSEGFFQFKLVAEANVKENGSPSKVYRVMGSRAGKTRFDVSAERGLTALVGRKRELDLLVDAFSKAVAGEGRVCSIVGEAGVGKSRLVYEFARAVSGDHALLLEGKCLPYGRNLAYHPITDILRANFNIEETDGDSQIRAKVHTTLAALGADKGFTLSYLLELLSVRNSGIDNILIGPEAKREGITQAIKTLVLKASQVRPLVLVIEDLHWIDRSSEDLSRELVEILPGSPILLIFTYRPDFQHGWEDESVMTRIELSRLTRIESAEMVWHLLDSERSDEALERFILEKAEGVPFFIEEYIRSLRHLEIIERKGSVFRLAAGNLGRPIPTTIQDVILARVDRLPEPSKRLLMKGSVVGREFSLPLIGRLAGLPEEELSSCLRTLQQAGLLQERLGWERPSYAFRHAMTRDAIYESMLAPTRKELHEEVARSIESLYGTNLQDHYPVLADHYFAGDNFERAALFAKLSSQRARKTGSLTDAVAYARKRVATLEQLTRNDEIALQIAKSRIVLGLILLEMNYLPEAKEAIEPIISEALKSDQPRMQSQILSILGIHSSWVEEDLPDAIEQLGRALSRSEAAGDVGTSLHASHWLGISYAIDCQFEEGIQYHLKAIRLAESIGDISRMSTLKSSLCGWCYFYHGKVADGYDLSCEAISPADKAGDIVAQSWAHVTRGMCCFGLGTLEEGIDHLAQADALSARANMFLCLSIAQHFLGAICLEKEEYPRARDHYLKAVEIGDRIHFLPSWVNLNKLGLAVSKAALGEKDLDLESLRFHRDKNKIKLFQGILARHTADILMRLDEKYLPDAEKCIDDAVEADKANGLMFHLAKDYEFAGQLLERLGDREKARKELSKAIKIYGECGARGRAKKVEKKLAPLV
jgi:class 3 adenylate cyclase/tetratricopeptide (TPR) repeat protein